ncbi:MAG: sigma-70 family RNA polymerase sigma factor [Phycisphaerales bacterium JB043]
MPEDITQLLSMARDGDREAGDRLFSIVYEELRGLAAAYLQSERVDHTLQPTAVVHEAYLRLAGSTSPAWNDRAHFFRAAALAMRRVLVNHARDRNRLKRGGVKGHPKSLDDLHTPITIDNTFDLLALDEALEELRCVDERKESVVELRFFGGLDAQATADVLGISLSQVKRDWTAAKAYLTSRLHEQTDDP